MFWSYNVCLFGYQEQISYVVNYLLVEKPETGNDPVRLISVLAENVDINYVLRDDDNDVQGRKK